MLYQYYYNGCWVRSVYDENNQILYFNAVEDKDVVDKGTPLYLQTVRNTVTNEVEKLVEMTRETSPCLYYNPAVLISSIKARNLLYSYIIWV